MVSTDPLWVDARVKLATARRLKVGQAASVRFQKPGAAKTRNEGRSGTTELVPGTIIFTSGQPSEARAMDHQHGTSSSHAP